MSENQPNKPKSYAQVLKESALKEKQYRQRMDKVRKDTVKWLKKDKAITAYFSQFSSRSVEYFITDYAHNKGMFLEYGSSFQEMIDEKQSIYFERADTCLKEIQLKKLFNLYCLWCAEQVTLDGIFTTWDFFPLAADVMNCTLITPIHQDEFDLYMQYAQSNQFEYTDNFDWLDTSDLRHDSEDLDMLPRWFQYCNTYTGDSSYLLLPNIRDEKEDIYRGLWRAEQDAEIEAKYASGELKRNVRDDRPDIRTRNYEQMIDFMKRFETPAVIRLFEGYNDYGKKSSIISEDEDGEESYLDEQVEDIMHAINSLSGTKIPIEANADWRKGLIAAWQKFEQTETATCLSYAYDNYLFRRQNNILFEKDSHLQFKISLANDVRKQILRGRVLNGEPEDFNF
jgi:hypothetical protein